MNAHYQEMLMGVQMEYDVLEKTVKETVRHLLDLKPRYGFRILLGLIRVFGDVAGQMRISD